VKLAASGGTMARSVRQGAACAAGPAPGPAPRPGRPLYGRSSAAAAAARALAGDGDGTGGPAAPSRDEQAVLLTRRQGLLLLASLGERASAPSR
jgi:hypothetical protein